MTGWTLLTLVLGTLLGGIVSSAHAEGRVPSAPATSQDASAQRINAMKISIKIRDEVVTAILMDNATSRDFVSLLPMDLTLEDYAGTEKISNLPRRLSTEGAPPGSDPSLGDIAYYAPWGNLAIFYKDFRHSSGLIKLGKIDSGIVALKATGSAKVTIELIDKSQ